MKNLTDFRKTVETGVDPRLLWYSTWNMKLSGGSLTRTVHLWPPVLKIKLKTAIERKYDNQKKTAECNYTQ